MNEIRDAVKFEEMNEMRKYQAVTEKGYIYPIEATSMKLEFDNIVFRSDQEVIGIFPAKTTIAHRLKE